MRNEPEQDQHWLSMLCGISMLLILVSPVTALGFDPMLGIHGGFGLSDFDESFPLGLAEHDHVGHFPIGIQVQTEALFCLGVGMDLSFQILPFQWDQNGSNAVEKVSQWSLSGYGRYELQNSVIAPHIIGGFGLTFGRWILDYTDEDSYADQSIGFKPAPHIFGGLGLSAHIDERRTLFFDILYTVLNRRLDREDSKTFSYNSWLFRIGILGPPW